MDKSENGTFYVEQSNIPSLKICKQNRGGLWITFFPYQVQKSLSYEGSFEVLDVFSSRYSSRYYSRSKFNENYNLG